MCSYFRPCSTGLRAEGEEDVQDQRTTSDHPSLCGERGDLRFTVTAMPVDRSLSQKWFIYPEPEFSQDFVGDYRPMDLATAIDTVLSDHLAQLEKSKSNEGGCIAEVVQAGIENIDLRNISPQMAGIREGITKHRFPIYKAAIRLIVNALCYIASYPDDIDSVWPLGAPESLDYFVD